ncbi:MAG: aminotransferase class V-fold PLP-dependent enzyme [Bacteroidota bacterium]|nr:aminotransferase class V-fold PLP-dependent enzyme [Bacteroidota bacterium]
MKTEITQSLENYFATFRDNVIGNEEFIEGPYGQKRIIYADWTASGRLYGPIEKALSDSIGPYVANTHTETSYTGALMTRAYHEAKKIIKDHVNASQLDALIPVGSGMTGAVVKFQRMLGLKYPDRLDKYVSIPEEDRPVVFITHMEHHSNQTSWLETFCKVECMKADNNGLVDLSSLDDLLEKYKDHKLKIASVTGCSNVTGIQTPYHQIAKKMHQAGGLCFVDFACSGPYVEINMHPEDPEMALDAIFFSPHKFLGGPGTPGVLIFNSLLYNSRVPDQPGGGTVTWTNPWGGHSYNADIEVREDGGTPPFLQTMKAAMAIRLKEKMGVRNILRREHEMIDDIFDRLESIPNLHILAGNTRDRLGVISFFIEGLHYNLGVKLLNDRFGVQVRGGCSCAGTYGHYLLNLSPDISQSIWTEIAHGDLSAKPGWIRMSIHPTMTDQEVEYICHAIREIAENHREWSEDYRYDKQTNEFFHLRYKGREDELIRNWFELDE